MIAVLLVLGALAALLASRGDDAPAARSPARSPRRRWSLLLAGTVIAVGVSGGQGPASSTDAERLVSAQSNRYGVLARRRRGVRRAPAERRRLRLVRRRVAAAARDRRGASATPTRLYLETAAELGLVGLAALIAFLAGIVLAARSAREPAAVAALAAFALHAGLDWDWELPALSLVAILLAARVIAAEEP